ncbi:phosphotransferase [Bradyrhizobium guangdongense]|uniref:phosphotransferase n=1 Tax=Bradyrhizobium guangdongense TaxID=1325090 RepID=UPI00112EC5FF|nr:phosphotransferase [Bradyrhizobium guangdongense]TPQ27140.1 phosphotransferase [Bradyrhizobium guangdongense]
MQGSLGEKIGEGVFADVHAWAPGQVVKLSKPGIPQWVVQHEAQMTRAVFAAGGPAPEVFGEVTLDGRFGIVLPRFDGPTLTQAVRTGAVTREEAGAILATLCLAVHRTRPPPGPLSLHEAMAARLQFAGRVLPERVINGVLALIEHLRHDDVLCHSDLHPSNVIMTAQGPRLIDWLGAARAPAAYEMAQCHVLIAELDPENADDPERAPISSVLQAEYARLAGITPATLRAAMQPYLPIVRVFLLLGGAKPEMRERQIQRVESALRAEG